MKHLIATGMKLVITLSLIFGLSGYVLAEGEEQKTNKAEAILSEAVAASDPLIGAWTVTLTNNTTKIKNPALYSFLRGGVLSQSENHIPDPMLGNLAFGNAHGAWKYNAGSDSYSIRYYKLVFQADAAFWGHEETTGTLRFNDDGDLVGTIKVGNIKAEFNGKRIIAK